MTIVDSQQAIHGQPHASFVGAVVAALSADPESIEELTAAIKRFVEPSEHGVFSGFRAGVCEETYDAGLCVINLAERLVVVESTYSRPGSKGHVDLRRSGSPSEYSAPYHLAEEWRFSSVFEGWECQIESPKETTPSSRPDTRDVLYGQVCPFIVEECFALRNLSDANSGAKPWTPPKGWSWRGIPERAASEQPLSSRDGVAELHARWLITPRSDLDGQSPRDVLLARKDHIDRDLQDRASQWSFTDECPSGLSTQSAAYRFFGYGTHEVVLYYELARDLVWDCWNRLVEPQSSEVPACSSRVAEVLRLERVKDNWLSRPDPEDLQGFTPTFVIERERMRLPLAVSGEEAMIDHDCPLCQMMGESMGPVFWHLDGCNMDDNFAFSFHMTREAWLKERREWEDFSRRFDEEQQRRAASESGPDDDDELPF